MFRIWLHVKVGSALRPEEFPTPERIETKVEEIISLGLQTTFDFAQTEVTGIGYEDCEPLKDEPSVLSELPEDLL